MGPATRSARHWVRQRGRKTLHEMKHRPPSSERSTLTYCDALIIPLHGEDAATLLIEDGSVGRAAPFGHTATRVIVDISIAVEIGFSV